MKRTLRWFTGLLKDRDVPSGQCWRCRGVDYVQQDADVKVNGLDAGRATITVCPRCGDLVRVDWAALAQAEAPTNTTVTWRGIGDYSVQGAPS